MMKIFPSKLWAVSAIFGYNRKNIERSIPTASTMSDDSFVTIGNSDIDTGKEMDSYSSLQDSFEVDLELEDMAILQENINRQKYLPNFDYEGLGGIDDLKYLKDLSSMSNLEDIYSYNHHGQTLFLTSNFIIIQANMYAC